MAGRGIEALARLGRIIPEVRKPKKKIPLTEKLLWTALVLIVFLVMSQIPLYPKLAGGDPFGVLRVIFASSRGTLMELGIGPIVTAGLILQLLVGSKIISLDMSNPDDRAAYTAANKVFAVLFTAFEAAAFILGGAFGALPPNDAFLYFLQLMAAGVVVILLDELVQKGWGLGSGISIFIAAGVAQTIFWSSFSPLRTFDLFYDGALLAFFQTIPSANPLFAFFRDNPNAPTMIGLTATIIVFLVVIYMEGVKVEIPVAKAGYRGYRGTYPIKLLYVSNIPVILAAALFADFFFFAKILSGNLGQGSYWADLLIRETNQTVTGGFVYYVTPPRNIWEVSADPARALVYLGIFTGICVLFAVTWVEIGGLGPRKVAKQLIDAGMQVPGFRRSERTVESILKRYIPVVTVLGGLIIGLLAASADFVGAFGTGTGILLTTGIMWQYYQILMKERVEEMYPGLSKLLG